MNPRRPSVSGWGFVAFPLAILFLFTALPTVAGLALSAFEWSGGTPPRFVGLSNFIAASRDPTLHLALRNTLIFSALSVPLTVILAFPLAAALHAEWFVGRTLMRTLYFLPMVISIVAIGLIWRWVLEPSDAGLLNHAVEPLLPPLERLLNIPHALGWPCERITLTLPNWLGNSPWGLTTIIAVSVWRGLGFSVVLYLAAIGNVPRALYDAAAVDGAGPWQTLWRITWPTVRPMTVFLLITGMIGALQVFDVVYVMIGRTQQNWTDVLNLYLYREFTQGRMGYAATIGAVILALTAVITVLELWWLRERRERRGGRA
ncbi:MAG: sugar ABC transporter permease [Phycisphaerales bacterium]|nr:sugar ABC transporter permease [Phycisphaerales bacterium]